MNENRWRELVRTATERFATPFYLFACDRINEAIEQLAVLESDLPMRHWYSFKTCPVAPVVRYWKGLGLGVEIVSEFEFLACLREGFSPERILVNGVGKHVWLPRYSNANLTVIFDSRREVHELGPIARRNHWRTGLRYHVPRERDPDEPAFSTQFGLSDSEFQESIEHLKGIGIEPRIVSFHVRSSIPDISFYRESIQAVSVLCEQLDFSPSILDIGGGLPAPNVLDVEGHSGRGLDLRSLASELGQVSKLLPSVREIWCENGRFVTAGAAVLVIKVVDIKERDGIRFVICDGGRTNHALVSDWEVHNFFVLPDREGKTELSTVCGPTCMSFDRLIRARLPVQLDVGDCFVWMDAGAYHIPWETRFSGGLASVLWSGDRGGIEVARQSEDFERWWSMWS